MPKWLQSYMGESLGSPNSDYVIYGPPLTNMVGYLCIFSPLNMPQEISCLPQYHYAFRVHLCVFSPLNMLEDIYLGKRRYLLGKQVVLWPNQSHWLAAFFTLHSLLSFLAARGKAFGHFNGGSSANSLFCKDIFCVFLCTHIFVLRLLQSNSFLKFVLSSFGFGRKYILDTYLL